MRHADTSGVEFGVNSFSPILLSRKVRGKCQRREKLATMNSNPTLN